MDNRKKTTEKGTEDGKEEGDGGTNGSRYIVLDVTKFASVHPGGDLILLAAGKDASVLFETYHPRGIPKSLIEKLRIGTMEDGSFGGKGGSFYSWDSDFYDALKSRVVKRLEERGLSRRGSIEIQIKALLLLVGFWYSLSNMACSAHRRPFLVSIMWSICMGISAALIGTNIQHDGNHGAFAKSKYVNKIAGWTMDMIGASAFTWEIQHMLGHHPYTNVLDTVEEERKGMGVDCKLEEKDQVRYYCYSAALLLAGRVLVTCLLGLVCDDETTFLLGKRTVENEDMHLTKTRDPSLPEIRHAHHRKKKNAPPPFPDVFMHHHFPPSGVRPGRLLLLPPDAHASPARSVLVPSISAPVRAGAIRGYDFGEGLPTGFRGRDEQALVSHRRHRAIRERLERGTILDHEANHDDVHARTADVLPRRGARTVPLRHRTHGLRRIASYDVHSESRHRGGQLRQEGAEWRRRRREEGLQADHDDGGHAHGENARDCARKDRKWRRQE